MSNNRRLNMTSRRRFLKQVGGATAAVTVGASNLSARTLSGGQTASLTQTESANDPARVKRAYEVRQAAALEQKAQPLPVHRVNGDEEAYRNYIGNYSKGLPHNRLGEVDAKAYAALLRALQTGEPADFAAIPVGGTVTLSNPQAALAFDLIGADSHHLTVPPPPAFNSEEQAAEMVELYWQAMTRDVPFVQYDTDRTIAAAVSDLRKFSRFGGVTQWTLFRGEASGDALGPYVSQFLWKPVPYGGLSITQQYRVPIAGTDYMTTYSGWLNCQNGMAPAAQQLWDASPRYLRNGRDLAESVHRDFTYQVFLNAALILLSFGNSALDDANPYKNISNQSGFATFGAPHI
ncbi:MAG: twin-arginine translocation signal domain-containing protein, partial [Acidobacteria bacterium]|nr:twin-arginine translocation signal domain-containing protein [Acidobacteriota bacterium]